MDLVLRVGLTAFIFYTPILLFFLYIGSKKYKGYSILSQWLSDLGDSRYKSSILVVSAWVVYGLVYPFFIWGLSNILPDLVFSSLVVFLFSVFLVFGLLASLLPNNKYNTLHYICVIIDLLCLTLSYVLLTYIILGSDPIPKNFIIFNIVIIALTIVFVYSFAKIFFKARRTGYTLYKVIREEKSFVLHYITALEWAYILLMVLYNFALSVVILQTL